MVKRCSGLTLCTTCIDNQSIPSRVPIGLPRCEWRQHVASKTGVVSRLGKRGEIMAVVVVD